MLTNAVHAYKLCRRAHVELEFRKLFGVGYDYYWYVFDTLWFCVHLVRFRRSLDIFMQCCAIFRHLV